MNWSNSSYARCFAAYLHRYPIEYDFFKVFLLFNSVVDGVDVVILSEGDVVELPAFQDEGVLAVRDELSLFPDPVDVLAEERILLHDLVQVVLCLPHVLVDCALDVLDLLDLNLLYFLQDYVKLFDHLVG